MRIRKHCTQKAYDIWMDICSVNFDYDHTSWVTNKAYDIHNQIWHLLRTGEIWDGGWES